MELLLALPTRDKFVFGRYPETSENDKWQPVFRESYKLQYVQQEMTESFQYTYRLSSHNSQEP